MGGLRDDSDYSGTSERESKYSKYENEPSDARIQAQLGFMAEQIAITQKMFSELTNRIEPVLLPEMDETGMLESPERKAASEISNVLDDLNGQVMRLQERINRVLKRVQL